MNSGKYVIEFFFFDDHPVIVGISDLYRIITIMIHVFLTNIFIKPMNSITRFSAIGIPAVIGIGIAWLGNRIIKNEKGLKDRELELKLHLSNKFH